MIARPTPARPSTSSSTCSPLTQRRAFAHRVADVAEHEQIAERGAGQADQVFRLAGDEARARSFRSHVRVGFGLGRPPHSTRAVSAGSSATPRSRASSTKLLARSASLAASAASISRRRDVGVERSAQARGRRARPDRPRSRAALRLRAPCGTTSTQRPRSSAQRRPAPAQCAIDGARGGRPLGLAPQLSHRCSIHRQLRMAGTTRLTSDRVPACVQVLKPLRAGMLGNAAIGPLWCARSTPLRRNCDNETDSWRTTIVPHFHNEPGVPVIEIGAQRIHVRRRDCRRSTIRTSSSTWATTTRSSARIARRSTATIRRSIRMRRARRVRAAADRRGLTAPAAQAVASSRNVIIAGAGIGGLTAALALAQRGFRVTVLEQAEQLRGNRRRHPALAQRHAHPDRARARRAAASADALRRRPSRSRSAAGGREIARIPLGARRRAALRRALLGRSIAATCRPRCSKRCAAIPTSRCSSARGSRISSSTPRRHRRMPARRRSGRRRARHRADRRRRPVVGAARAARPRHARRASASAPPGAR